MVSLDDAPRGDAFHLLESLSFALPLGTREQDL